MLSGNALARARRGHFLTDAALNILLLADTLELPVPHTSVSDNETQSAQDSVNVDQAEKVGYKILQSMEGKEVFNYSFK